MNYCFGDYGTQPSQAPQWMAMTLPRHFRNGGIFPVGGSSAITKAIAEPIWARNGKVLVRANVQEICIENGKATGVTVQEKETNVLLTNLNLEKNHVKVSD